MIPIARPLIGEEEKSAVLEVMASGQLAQGSKVSEFEEAFAAWCGTQHAVAVSSGTAALHIALLAHGIGSGDEVITTSFSFIASANCILFVGAQPRFADIEPEYFTIDPDRIAEQITPRTRAILPVHLFGQPCNMEAITQLADRHHLLIVEDACQAHGATYCGKKVGSDGVACYSFYPTKNMTSGEGGMITTDDAELAQRMRMIREHGMRRRYVHEMLGYNLRMTDLQAAIGVEQLKKVETWNRQRQANASYFSQRLQGVAGIQTPSIRTGASHVFHQYTLQVRDRDRMATELQARGVGVGVYYPIPIHQQQVYEKLSCYGDLSDAESASRRVLSIPVHPSLTKTELEFVADTVIEIASAEPAAIGQGAVE